MFVIVIVIDAPRVRITSELTFDQDDICSGLSHEPGTESFLRKVSRSKLSFDLDPLFHVLKMNHVGFIMLKQERFKPGIVLVGRLVECLDLAIITFEQFFPPI